MKNWINFLVDIGIFAAFLVAMEPRMTGEPVHEWLSIVLAGTVIVHLLLHWNWIVSVGKMYFVKLWHSSRLNFFLDVLLFLAFNAIMISGLMISKTVLPLLGIEAGMGGAWKMVHKISTDAAMWLIAAHVGLHWKWIWSMLKKLPSTLSTRFAQKNYSLSPVRVEARKK